MRKRVAGFGFALLLAAAVAGCAKTEDRTDQESGAAGEGAQTTDAAAGRGVPTGEGDVEASTDPRIVLDAIEYEWVVTPEQGLHVALDFSNPNQGYGRAKGSVFLISGSSQDPAVSGVYPWGARIEGGKPADHKAGGQLLFRTEQRMTVFIPYKERAGCYDTVRIVVFDADGAVVIDETHDLAVTGEPSGRRKIEQTLVL